MPATEPIQFPTMRNIQICPFEQMEPEDWFHLLEIQFAKRHFTKKEKLGAAVFKLPMKV